MATVGENRGRGGPGLLAARPHATADEIQAIGTLGRSMEVDVTVRDRVTASIDAAAEAFGSVHVVANVAGIPADGPVVDIDETGLDHRRGRTVIRLRRGSD